MFNEKYKHFHITIAFTIFVIIALLLPNYMNNKYTGILQICLFTIFSLLFLTARYLNPTDMVIYQQLALFASVVLFTFFTFVMDSTKKKIVVIAVFTIIFNIMFKPLHIWHRIFINCLLFVGMSFILNLVQLNITIKQIKEDNHLSKSISLKHEDVIKTQNETNNTYTFSKWIYINPQQQILSNDVNIFTCDVLDVNYHMDKSNLIIIAYGLNNKLIQYIPLNNFYQKWNNIVVNNTGKTIDVYLNNSLLSSKYFISKQFNKDISIAFGTNNEISGYIKYVSFLTPALKPDAISSMYLSQYAPNIKLYNQF
jgi:hypothetical protein